VQLDWPVIAWKVPASQSAHTVAANIAEYLPALHDMQLDEPVFAANQPAKHATQRVFEEAPVVPN